MKRALTALSVLAFAAAFAACAREAPSAARCNQEDAGMPVDPLLLAFLSRARAAHHLADDHEGAGDLNAALQPLAQLVTGPLPHVPSGEVAPEVREVLADTRARLADLRSRLGAYDQAITDVQAGLEQAQAPNYFRGHLLETEGLVEERRAKALEVRDPGAASAARQRSIQLLEQAMAVQARVIENAAGTPARSSIPAASARRPATDH
jgi:tetratricopeptide (TPR) repeat protein